jgi:hypothetical protein
MMAFFHREERESVARRKKAVCGFVLRCGYTVEFDEDVPAMMDHLKNAILGESLAACKRKRRSSWKLVAREIAAEIEHLAATMPPEIAKGLLIALLHERVIERLITIADDLKLKVPPKTTIQ